MAANRGVLSHLSPTVLIFSTVILIATVPFISRWEEFAGIGLIVVALSILSRTGWRFWARYLKISAPLIVLSVVFNWILNLPEGFRALGHPASFLTTPQNLQALWTALGIGGRFAAAIFFSFLLIHVCSHQELVWGLARVSDKLFKSPVVGEVLALTLLSVPFFMDSLSRVKKWKQVPDAIASVFHQAQDIVSEPIAISFRRPGWLLLSASLGILAAAVVVR